MTIDKVFDIFDRDRNGKLSKDVFVKCMQGMELGIAIEDLIDPRETRPYLCQFIDSMQGRLASQLGPKYRAGVRP